MTSVPIYRLSDNVTSPLGSTTAGNYEAVMEGCSALRCYDNWHGLGHTLWASLFTEEQTMAMAQDGLSRFESLAFVSARSALRDCSLDVSHSRVVFILSTTKANIEDGSAMPAESAQHIARRLGIRTQPIVVCNACISGVSAILLAQRLLSAGKYDYAVVCGADVQSRFTVAGFQSLGALSEEACRPFDMDRTGLNLGEAAATIVLSSIPPTAAAAWAVTACAVRNDAYSMVTPSRTAEGACRAIDAVACDDVAFVNAHGTGTLFNDQMEAVALSRMGLGSVPVNALKGYFGHTLGAAGILETVISMAAADAHRLPGTKGFSELGVSGKINISGSSMSIEGYDFIKIISGFGGGNGALRVQKVVPQQVVKPSVPCVLKAHSVHIAAPGRLSDLYRSKGVDYPRFFKMDGLCRLGFMAAEQLLPEVDDRTGCAVVLCCHSSSVVTDSRFLQALAEGEDVSPSLFIYTLPNIVTGEIAIRHRLNGETSLYILPRRDDELVWHLVETTFQDDTVSTVIGGWLDYADDEHYEADMYVACRE